MSVHLNTFCGKLKLLQKELTDAVEICGFLKYTEQALYLLYVSVKSSRNWVKDHEYNTIYFLCKDWWSSWLTKSLF